MTNRNRQEGREEESFALPTPGSTAVTAEALRSASQPAPAARGEERISTFWRVFGGTLLSIAALVCLTVYQQFNSGLSDLRGSIQHLNAEMVRKDEFNSRNTSLWTAIKEAQTAGPAVTAMKERQVLLEQQLKNAEDERKELTRELKRLIERLAVVEGRQSAASGPKLPAGPISPHSP